MDPKPTSIDCDHWPAPSTDDYYMLKRYEAFEAAADYVAGALASHPAVIRVGPLRLGRFRAQEGVRSEATRSRTRTQRC